MIKIELVELKNVTIPISQIMGIGKVTFDRRRFAFYVDVPGNRYVQSFSTNEEAVKARQDLIDRLLGGKKSKKAAKDEKTTETETQPVETPETDDEPDSEPPVA